MQKITESMQALAEQYRVRWERQGDGEYVIQGRRGDSHIYDPYVAGHLALALMENGRQVRGFAPLLTAHWKEKIKREHPEWRILQEGDAEACFLFPETDLPAALDYARVRRRKLISEATRQKLASMGHRFRPGTRQEAIQESLFSTI